MIWGLRNTRIKKLKLKSVFYNFFIQATVWFQIVIRRLTTDSCIKFTKNETFYFATPDPKSIQNPKYYISLESLYNF